MTAQEMNEEQKDQVIANLTRILKVYANPDYWGKLYGGYQNDRRLWLGEGQGWELAAQAIARTENIEE